MGNVMTCIKRTHNAEVVCFRPSLRQSACFTSEASQTICIKSDTAGLRGESDSGSDRIGSVKYSARLYAKPKSKTTHRT